MNASVELINAFLDEGIYNALKTAVRSFARCWIVNVKDRKMRVNALSPGPIDTPMLRNTADTKEEQDESCWYTENLNKLHLNFTKNVLSILQLQYSNGYVVLASFITKKQCISSMINK